MKFTRHYLTDDKAPGGPYHYRFRIETDDDWQTVEVADEQVTSASILAMPVDGGRLEIVELNNVEEVQWAIEALTAVRDAWRRERVGEAAGHGE